MSRFSSPRVASISPNHSSTDSRALTLFLTDDGPECVIAVMGPTGSGKTSFINIANGGDLQVGEGLHSCTSEVQVASTFELDGRRVTLIDTPGFDDTTMTDAEVLQMIAAFLAATYECGQKLAGVIYIHRISDRRMSGISSRNFKMFRQLCGDNTLKNVVILTNMWGEVSLEVGEAREQELRTQDKFFKPVLDKGAVLLRHHHTRESALKILRHVLKNNPVPLQIQRELVDEKKDISETAAGATLEQELRDQIKKHKKDMEKLKAEMKEAMEAKDEETKKELEEEAKKLHDQMRKVQNESQTMASQYKEEKARMDQRMEEIMEASRRAMEKAEAEYNKRIIALQEELSKSSSAAEEVRTHLQKEIEELRNRPTCCIQ